jgi:hypothetical protein
MKVLGLAGRPVHKCAGGEHYVPAGARTGAAIRLRRTGQRPYAVLAGEMGDTNGE